MKFQLQLVIVVLSSTVAASLFDHGKYEQKFVDINAWSKSDSIVKKRYS